MFFKRQQTNQQMNTSDCSHWISPILSTVWNKIDQLIRREKKTTGVSIEEEKGKPRWFINSLPSSSSSSSRRITFQFRYCCPWHLAILGNEFPADVGPCPTWFNYCNERYKLAPSPLILINRYPCILQPRHMGGRRMERHSLYHFVYITLYEPLYICVYTLLAQGSDNQEF